MTTDSVAIKVVYVCITGDLFHHGHVAFFRKSRAFGNRLLVGICSDEDVERYKRRPILTLHERSEVIRECKLVDGVIEGAPPALTVKFINEHMISSVVASNDYNDAILSKYYGVAKRRGILHLVDYTKGISATDIIHRCHMVATQFGADKATLN